MLLINRTVKINSYCVKTKIIGCIEFSISSKITTIIFAVCCICTGSAADYHCIPGFSIKRDSLCNSFVVVRRTAHVHIISSVDCVDTVVSLSSCFCPSIGCCCNCIYPFCNIRSVRKICIFNKIIIASSCTFFYLSIIKIYFAFCSCQLDKDTATCKCSFGNCYCM